MHTLGDSSNITLRDGRKLHFHAQGEGGPTVVFEAGMGFSSAMWGLVQPEISKHTFAVAYDRANIGESDDDEQPRTVDRIADDLEQLLNSLPGPFVLVGHSWGGPIVRRLAARGTFDIKGLVLVDQTDGRNPDYFKKVRRQKSRLIRLAVLWLMHTVGLRLSIRKILMDMPDDCRREIIWRDTAHNGLQAYDAELEHLIPGLVTMKEHPSKLKGIDVTLISGTDPKEMKEKLRPGLVNAHRETAKYLDRGKYVEAPKSGHYPLFTEPEIVIREIRELIEKNS